MKKIIIVCTCSIIVIFTIGCGGPSSEVLAVTMVAQTDVAATQTHAAAATSTPTKTNTPSPTDTPMPTETPTSTPTPVPEPDAKAMIAWRELDFSEKFIAFPPSAIGIEEGADAFSLQADDGSTLSYKIAGSFVFADSNDPTQLIYGYTVLLPSSKDTDAFDEYTLYGLTGLINSAFGVSLSSISSIASANDIGNVSSGVTAPYSRQGAAWQISMISFRVDKIGAWVFVRNKADIQSPISVENVARVYASSIQQPVEYCRLVSVEPDMDADVPTFDFEAEGFYPGEGRYITLEGIFYLGDETKTATNAKMGLTGDKFDKNGHLVDAIGFLTVEQLADQGMENAELPTGPTDFTLTVGGHASGCEIEQIVTWLGP